MNNNISKISMDDIMQASIGEVYNELTVTFKKTVLLRQYETEVLESTTSVKLDHPITGIERMFITAMLEIQMEYTAYVNLASKGIVTQSQLLQRKQMLEEGLFNIKYKADSILGAGVIDKYINYNNLEKVGD